MKREGGKIKIKLKSPKPRIRKPIEGKRGQNA